MVYCVLMHFNMYPSPSPLKKTHTKDTKRMNKEYFHNSPREAAAHRVRKGSQLRGEGLSSGLDGGPVGY